MKNLVKWFMGLFSRKCVPQDTRKENLYLVLWRTKDTGWRKFFKMKKNEEFEEIRVLKKFNPL